jgi:hypothetical protein
MKCCAVKNATSQLEVWKAVVVVNNVKEVIIIPD